MGKRGNRRSRGTGLATPQPFGLLQDAFPLRSPRGPLQNEDIILKRAVKSVSFIDIATIRINSLVAISIKKLLPFSRSRLRIISLFAVRGGFEPPVRLPVRQFSKLVVSATHPNFLTALFSQMHCKITTFFGYTKGCRLLFSRKM